MKDKDISLLVSIGCWSKEKLKDKDWIKPTKAVFVGWRYIASH